jgi:hypothetical protein
MAAGSTGLSSSACTSSAVSSSASGGSEIEQCVVRPVQIFEDEHERVLLRERLEEAPPRGEHFCPAVLCETLSLEPDERAQVPLEPARVFGSGDRFDGRP